MSSCSIYFCKNSQNHLNWKNKSLLFVCYLHHWNQGSPFSFSIWKRLYQIQHKLFNLWMQSFLMLRHFAIETLLVLRKTDIFSNLPWLSVISLYLLQQRRQLILFSYFLTSSLSWTVAVAYLYFKALPVFGALCNSHCLACRYLTFFTKCKSPLI